MYLDWRFKYFADEFIYTDLEKLLSEVKSSQFRLSLCYIVSDFKPSDSRNENYGLIFFESANKPVISVCKQLFYFSTNEHLRISGIEIEMLMGEFSGPCF